jgi:hypothetical protein
MEESEEAEESGEAIARSLSTACIGLRVTKGINHYSYLATKNVFHTFFGMIATGR